MADEDQKKTGALTAFMNKGGAVALSKEQRAAALSEALDEGTSGDGDVLYLNFSGQGANYAGWQMGRDKTKPDPEAVYIVDPLSIVEGWIVWKGGSPAFKAEWSVYERATRRMTVNQLPDHGPYNDGDGPQFSMGMSMFDVDEPGRQIKFGTSSTSGKNALGDLLREVTDRMLADDPEVPVVMLNSEQFTSQGKKNGKPKFVVEGWVTPDEVHAYLAMGDDGDLETLLNGGYTAKAEPEPEPEPAADAEAEAKPKRRARRSAAA
jgi:hypothetical protein